jgi:toxin FitB
VKYLLDTDVISQSRRAHAGNQPLITWLNSVPATDIATSVLVLAEVRRGIVRLERRDPAQAATLERWLASARHRLGPRVLAFDETVADVWARLPGRTLPLIDSMIAATAIVHGLTLVTRNVADMAGTGAAIFDPWA